MSKSAKKTEARAAATRAVLVEAFPACFAGKGEKKRPLAVGIDRAIMSALPELGFRRVLEALADYTSGPTYLKGVVAGAARVGLDGAACGEVSAAQAAHAAARLQRPKKRPVALAIDPASSVLSPGGRAVARAALAALEEA